jgi:outer membrane receptor protein involved in Fe transport
VIAIQPSDVATINARLDAVGFQGPRIETGLVPGGYNTTNFFGRVDHKLDEKNDLSVTYNFYDIDAINARTVGGLNSLSRGTNLENQDHTINTQLITVVRPSLLNEFRVEFRRSRLAAPPIDQTGPAVNISGIASFGNATSSPTRRDIDLFQLSDSVTSVWKDHSFKAGGELIYNDLNIEFPGALQGVYSFNNLNAFLSGTNGVYSQFQQAFGAPAQRQKNPNIGFFGQDEWRFSRKLTFNLGLRYDLQFLPSPISTDTDNISPRLGFAYSPDEKTVVRGSFGMYYDRIPTRATSNALQRDGSKYIVAVFTPSTPGAPVFPNVLSAQPSSLTIKPSITRIDPDIENSESTQASLQIDRALQWESKLSVGYMFLGARHLILSRNAECSDMH